MAHVQEYVSGRWCFAGMKHVPLILEFLKCQNPWVPDIIPELHTKSNRLRDFLKAYQRLGADGSYMMLLNLPEAATSIRKHLGLHVGATSALALFDYDSWLNYKGVPRDQEEEAVFNYITTIRKVVLGVPKLDQGGSGDSADA